MINKTREEKSSRLWITLPGRLADLLDERCAETGLSRSVIVILALNEHLGVGRAAGSRRP